MISLTPGKDMFDRIQREFSMNLSDRLRVIAEVDRYRWKEDESVWKQKRERSALAYEVYFDREFVANFDISEDPDAVYLKIMTSIRDLYKTKKIFFNKQMYVIEDEKRIAEQKKNEFKLPTAVTPEEKIINEVVKRQRRRRARK